MQQGYNAGAAPAQQGYTAGGTPAQQQGYGQPAASVGLGVDQQSKLAQIIAQVRAAPTRLDSALRTIECLRTLAESIVP